MGVNREDFEPESYMRLDLLKLKVCHPDKELSLAV